MTKPTIKDVQYITQADGRPEFAVVPIELWHEMTQSDERSDDEVAIPDEVVSIMFDKHVSMMAAWRIYKGHSQEFMAQQLDCSQGAVAQAEDKNKRSQRRTLEKWAAILECEWEQLKPL